jgi:hypothetical protein
MTGQEEMIRDRQMPPKSSEEMERLNMFVPARIMRRIDAWRRRQPRLGTLSEDVRRVLEAGIEALEGHHKPKPKADKNER